MARRSLQLQTRTFRLNAGCSPGWGPTGVAIPRVLRIGTTLEAPVTIALLKRAGILEDVLEEGGLVVIVCGMLEVDEVGVLEVASAAPFLRDDTATLPSLFHVHAA